MGRIIAVDYDGTLEIGGKLNMALMERLGMAQRLGDVVILWTCREGKSLMEAVERLARAGFQPNKVNRNCAEGIRRMGHDSRKVFADIYIDDKNAR